MKILVVHEVNYLSKIIYEFQILPEILSTLGHDVTVVDYNDTWNTENGRRFQLRTVMQPGIHRAYPCAAITLVRPGMIRMPVVSRISGAVASGLEVNRLLRDSAADVVLLYGLPTVGVQTITAARTHGIPVVFRAIDVSHELVPYPLLVSLTRLLEKFVFNTVDFNVALTPHIRSYIHEYGVAESKIRLLPSGVDIEMFSPGVSGRAALSNWGIASGDPVILFMGTIYRFSGLDRVIAGFPDLLKDHPSAKLLIVGTGDDESRLKALTKEMGLSTSVVFAGMQPYDNLPALLRASTVCINPFELNGVTERILPTKLFQYLACGKPVVATNLPGTIPFLAGEEHGVVYSELNNFVQTLSSLLADESRQKRLGEAGTKTAAAYDWRRIASQLAAWLGELV